MSLIGSMFTGIRQSFRESFLGGDDDVWMETLKSDYANCDDFSDSDDEESVCSYLSAKYNNNSAPEQASPLEAKLAALPSSSAEEKVTTAKRSSGLLMDFPSSQDETPAVSFSEPLEATTEKSPEEATVEAQEEPPKEAPQSVKEVKGSPKDENEVKENPKNEATEPPAPLDVMSVHGTKDTRASIKEESSRSSLSMSTHSSSSSSSQRKSRRHRSSSRRSVSLSPKKDTPGLRRSNTHSHSSPKKEQSSLGPMLRRNKTTATSSRRTSSRSPKRTSSKTKETAFKTPESLLTMSVHGTKDTRASIKENSSSSSKGSLLGDLSMHSTTDSQRKSRRHRSPRRSQSHSLSPKKDASTLGSLLHRSKTTMTDAIPRLPGRSTSPSPCDKSMSNSSSRSARRRDMGALSRSTNHNEKPCFDWEAYGKVKARVEAKKERSSSADKKKGRGQQQRKPKHMSPTRRERRSPSFYSSVLGNLANDENAPQKRA